MIQVDLITGFLGSGKTTFLKKYAKYLLDQGLKVGILENDFGAVNVDMMLLGELESADCGLEMVAGGCDADCHRRRFKTKLIAMGMSSYDRVLIEPSGLFDVDEFFDALYEEPLSRWYQIGNVFAIVDANLESNLSEQSEYLLASQIANAGVVLLSKVREASDEEIARTIGHMNRALEYVKCDRRFSKDQGVLISDWDTWSDNDFRTLMERGYRSENFRKLFSGNDGYQRVYLINQGISAKGIREKIQAIMEDTECGHVFRIKGFVQCEEGWMEVNATREKITVQPISKGQDVLIVIGENLREDALHPALTSL